jgi:uncharacterized protein (TIGR02996 family)
MNEEDLLLRAVCNDPEDDLPRLVYADWLQENGEECRAEYIRSQVALYRKYEKVPHHRRVKEGYYNNLVWGLDRSWRGFERPKGYTIKDEYWERGFLWEVRWDWDYFWSDPERLKAVFSRHPIRRLWITDKEAGPFLGVAEVFAFGFGGVSGCPSDLPIEMGRWMASGRRYTARPVAGEGKEFAVFDQASWGTVALSVATVRYARSLAGLRDLTDKERFPKGRKK